MKEKELRDIPTLPIHITRAPHNHKMPECNSCWHKTINWLLWKKHQHHVLNYENQDIVLDNAMEGVVHIERGR